MQRDVRLLIAICAGLGLVGSTVAGCSAGTGNSGGDAATGGTGSGNNPAVGAGTSAGAGDVGGQGAGFVTSGGNGTGGEGGSIIVNPCGTGCGPVELCDGVNKGLDDNCDGDVDEGCPCGPGEASSCFRGDPSFLTPGNPGCHVGSMSCTENGDWGPCTGGSHAVPPDNCQSADQQGCHAISTSPFTAVDLSMGAGNFDDNAMSEMYEVDCPMGVNPCPAPNGTTFQPVVSGEYTVHYTKVVNGQSETCDFPLYVGAKGLRVELSWNYPSTGNTDLDLHMKQPMSTSPWNTSGTGAQPDCGWGNCKGFDFLFPTAASPHWFPDANMVPDPVNWFEDPNTNANSCYFAPRGAGADWTDPPGPMGCHNPRLDIDNITCTPSVSDPNSTSFCAPENINVDYPPKNQWTRIAVHYYGGFANGQVFPNVKIFCDGALAADLGTQGFHTPESPFAWNSPGDVDKVWLVADVLFREDQCVKECIVEPLRTPPNNDPVVLTVTQAEGANGNGPAYPPIPP